MRYSVIKIAYGANVKWAIKDNKQRREVAHFNNQETARAICITLNTSLAG